MQKTPPACPEIPENMLCWTMGAQAKGHPCRWISFAIPNFASSYLQSTAEVTTFVPWTILAFSLLRTLVKGLKYNKHRALVLRHSGMCQQSRLRQKDVEYYFFEDVIQAVGHPVLQVICTLPQYNLAYAH